jgi:GAF domain-containing protein
VSRADELSDFLPAIALRLTERLDEKHVVDTAVEGLVSDCGAAMARIWIAGSPSRSRFRSLLLDHKVRLALKAECTRKVNLDAEKGREVMAAAWIATIARGRVPIASSRLFHGGHTPDASWMRQNRFRTFAGYPLLDGQVLLGVLAVFSRHTLTERSFRLLGIFSAQLASALRESKHREQEDLTREMVGIPAGTSLDEAMKTYIEHALDAASGRIEGPHGAAESLGIHPNTLRSRMSKLGVLRR